MLINRGSKYAVKKRPGQILGFSNKSKNWDLTRGLALLQVTA